MRFVLFFIRITHMLFYFVACIWGKNKPRLQSTPFLAREFVKFCCEKTYLLKFVSVFCQLISHNLSLVYWNQHKLCIRSCCFRTGQCMAQSTARPACGGHCWGSSCLRTHWPILFILHWFSHTHVRYLVVYVGWVDDTLKQRKQANKT